MRNLPALLAGILALLLAGCRPEQPPNVLLISIDALRADRLGTYGNSRETSPFLDSLASRGILFENAFVNTHGTTPSHTTILSGVYQQTHGVGLRDLRDGVVGNAIPEGLPLLQQHLRKAGFSTIAVTAGGNMGGKFGFSRGFDVFDDRGGDVETLSRRLAELVGQARAAEPRKPVFAFLHTYQVHSPYRPPKKYREMFGLPPDERAATTRFLRNHARSASSLPPQRLAMISTLYDAELRYTDDTLSELFDQLAEIGFLEGALVVVTADHGEELGEHGGLLHRGLLYEELIKVPLIVAGPGIPAKREPALVSTVDIVPSLLDYLDLASPDFLEGSSFLADPGPRRAVVAQYSNSRYAIRTREWKLIRNEAAGSFELYDLAKDPRERKNLADARPEVRDRLDRALAGWKGARRTLTADQRPVQLDPREREKLRALGYLGGD